VTHESAPGVTPSIAVRWAKEATIAAALLVGYSLLLVVLIPHMGLSVRGFTMLVVAAGAWRWGVPGGVAIWLATVVINSWAAYLALDAVGYGLNVVPYIISTLALGVLVGRFRRVGQRLKTELAERERMQTALRESEEGYRLLFQDNPLPMWVMDIESRRFLATNEAASRHYGYSADEFMAMAASDLVPEEDRQNLLARLAAPLPRLVRGVRLRHRKQDGTIIDVEITAHNVQFQGKRARLVLANDVTERVRVEERLHYQATHDELTGLPNRTLLQEHLEQNLALSRRSSRDLALLLLDLDRFKDINDTLGHQFGDLVLQQISERFRPALRDSDILARLGGDEFAIILPETDEHGALQVCERLLESLVEPFQFKEQRFDVGASIGVAMFPSHGEDATTLLRLADVAMYLAKRSAAGFAMYSSLKNQYTPRRLALVAELRQGIENDQLLLHYQPKLDLRTMRVRSA
jgi:diguanylate cyclase (GGDEF)-like protein/PAS domain S-box-containing protein